MNFYPNEPETFTYKVPVLSVYGVYVHSHKPYLVSVRNTKGIIKLLEDAPAGVCFENKFV